MPVYQYKCDDCGLFEETKPLSLFAEPCKCPACGAISPRALTVPQMSVMTSYARRSHAINERSADSPKRAKANGLTPSGPRIKRGATSGANGFKNTPNARPWMLS